ncbi:kinesin motor domain-containing protein [Cyclospora cayetanensis]|uniref:Kinesin motor domain-containing protein n=1 Tax=Cyclospora cayetanensis TaxID=88456 RepID=A0A1D3D0D8_9EIME|nr:kinesin motor domain-containing protein [Cyclospora cayetanensis]
MGESLPELSGRIRTFVRIRPPQGREKDAEIALRVPSASRVEVSDSVRRHRWAFEVDRVFGPSANHQDIWEPVERCIERVMEGYSCSIFAHGQTGTGKTYTMLGPEIVRGCGCADPKIQLSSKAARLQLIQKRLSLASSRIPSLLKSKSCGIIPRACERIFQLVRSRYGEDSGAHVKVFASYIQVYNDKLVDLLAGLQLFEVTSCEELLHLLLRGTFYRTFRATRMNPMSSRSHAIFQVELRHCLPTNSAVFRQARLNLVDLAGNERCDPMKSVGKSHMEEMGAINRSLSALILCIQQLNSEGSTVSFRSSALTRLLQESLGGGCFTAFICTISPSSLCIPSCPSSPAMTLERVDIPSKILGAQGLPQRCTACGELALSTGPHSSEGSGSPCSTAKRMTLTPTPQSHQSLKQLEKLEEDPAEESNAVWGSPQNDENHERGSWKHKTTRTQWKEAEAAAEAVAPPGPIDVMDPESASRKETSQGACSKEDFCCCCEQPLAHPLTPQHSEEHAWAAGTEAEADAIKVSEPLQEVPKEVAEAKPGAHDATGKEGALLPSSLSVDGPDERGGAYTTVNSVQHEEYQQYPEEQKQQPDEEHQKHVKGTVMARPRCHRASSMPSTSAEGERGAAEKQENGDQQQPFLKSSTEEGSSEVGTRMAAAAQLYRQQQLQRLLQEHRKLQEHRMHLTASIDRIKTRSLQVSPSSHALHQKQQQQQWQQSPNPGSAQLVTVAGAGDSTNSPSGMATMDGSLSSSWEMRQPQAQQQHYGTLMNPSISRSRIIRRSQAYQPQHQLQHQQLRGQSQDTYSTRTSTKSSAFSSNTHEHADSKVAPPQNLTHRETSAKVAAGAFNSWGEGFLLQQHQQIFHSQQPFTGGASFGRLSASFSPRLQQENKPQHILSFDSYPAGTSLRHSCKAHPQHKQWLDLQQPQPHSTPETAPWLSSPARLPPVGHNQQWLGPIEGGRSVGGPVGSHNEINYTNWKHPRGFSCDSAPPTSTDVATGDTSAFPSTRQYRGAPPRETRQYGVAAEAKKRPYAASSASAKLKSHGGLSETGLHLGALAFAMQCDQLCAEVGPILLQQKQRHLLLLALHLGLLRPTLEPAPKLRNHADTLCAIGANHDECDIAHV